jgi:hypothetical protein
MKQAIMLHRPHLFVLACMCRKGLHHRLHACLSVQSTVVKWLKWLVLTVLMTQTPDRQTLKEAQKLFLVSFLASPSTPEIIRSDGVEKLLVAASSCCTAAAAAAAGKQTEPITCCIHSFFF